MKCCTLSIDVKKFILKRFSFYGKIVFEVNGLKRFIALVLMITSVFFLFSCKGEEKEIKYVFLFVGDGMGLSEVALADMIGEGISFNDFESVGMVTTHNLSSEITDSASAATAFSSGKKTYSERVGLDGDGNEVATLTDLFKEKGFKTGLVSSQAVNHATPAAFYAHNESRYNYYEIGKDFCLSNIDFFGGAGFLEENDLYEIAESYGYTVAHSQDEIKGDKCLYVAESTALPYEIDRQNEQSLLHFLDSAINYLYSEDGFFIMCEGGRIDSACHANDAGTLVQETFAFDKAVKRAVEFYNNHPEETIIIVTADHETGGLTLGYTETEYEMYPEKLLKQSLSQANFESEYISKYLEEDTPFEEVEKDIALLFGLDSLTEYERDTLLYAYERTKETTLSYTAKDWILYSDRTALSVAVTRLLANKAGLDFTTYYHTAAPVGLWAKGAGTEIFNGYYDNTEIFDKISEICYLY